MPRLNPQDQRLSGEQFSEFYTAVLDAVSGVPELTRALQFGADQALAQLTGVNNPLEDIVFDVIQKADTRGWSAELLHALRAARPTNLKLLLFAQQFGLAPATPARRQLQLLIRAGDPLLEVDWWRSRMAERESQVCRVERDGTVLGTGFLVGPSVVLTNYHVLDEAIEKLIDHRKIRFRFDHKALPDGVGVNSGRLYGLAGVWDIAHSRYSELDSEPNAKAVPGADELDYALVRLDAAPGAASVTGANGSIPQAPTRGFVPMPDKAHDWQTRKDVMILQHPEGLPLKLAIRTDAVIDVRPFAAAPTRIRYATRTEPGSSGSPCFDLAWNLIALHHSGDPNYDEKLRVPAEWNEGIPLTAILQSLEEKGVHDEIGEQEK